jgi:hypothetical protein
LTSLSFYSATIGIYFNGGTVDMTDTNVVGCGSEAIMLDGTPSGSTITGG